MSRRADSSLIGSVIPDNIFMNLSKRSVKLIAKALAKEVTRSKREWRIFFKRALDALPRK